ncbi:MAG: hypothetical protein NC396_01070 [Bacteroides sp.]|nr:hypothetical protein [Bacteroides sp.]MCM1084914.1 hypothetical protein [Bacteroides sp.]
MKNTGLIPFFVLACLMSVFMFSCGQEDTKLAYSELCKGSTDGSYGQLPGYFLIREEGSYMRMIGNISCDIPIPDFTCQQVIALFDTTRTHPVYEIEVASMIDDGSFVNVSVHRNYQPQTGIYDQAYCIIGMERTEREVRFVEMPFEQEAEDGDYMPTMGVSSCLNRIASVNVAGEEYLWFRFTGDGKAVFEHRGMILNCHETVVDISVKQNGGQLLIEETENYAPDSMFATCICPKNVGYEAEVVSSGDSLQVDFKFTTFDRGLRTRSFKIPGSGSGKIYIGKNVW